MRERQLGRRRGVSFAETMDPNIRGIWNNGRYVGILLLSGEEVIVEFYVKNGSPVRTPVHVLEAVVKERDRIAEERSKKNY